MTEQPSSTRRRFSWRLLLVVLILTSPLIYFGFLYVGGKLLMAHRKSDEFRFDLQSSPAFLPEALAMEKAKATLALAGYDPSQWDPQKSDYNPSQAPDGTKDIFLMRSNLDPRDGQIQFLNRIDMAKGIASQRSVIMEIRDQNLVCYVLLPL